ncbi:hypothetical protein PUNSTDRAFT_140229 [Punctularia strigosozonata HHB-11173 SS5]|uniref:uncharacterized protein n=1 Tax=Punctularia strigosozonata (strain HHB-11173) TaxID=741275 RepID=UPI0004417BFC|nr:uncharacterized protein PUNSTDRAFT_140229 [Punctularia strigosozonata HHB-11173 SS5]EIN13763.1 hypothetical protein PUNSTDRAFT_140229 [Punctularia strigosozonata HHB-11173 SS5]
MFFSAELLSRRDDGFGLLWLAATLGSSSKSTFKKLPKRSVLSADIARLCGLITEPAEPLALRLSSNLMVGVDMNSVAASSAAQLQMGQSSLRPDALTLSADPVNFLGFDLDDLNYAWDEVAEADETLVASDEEYGVGAAKRKSKAKHKHSSSVVEHARANLHTLQEDHEHLLSNSFDASFSALWPQAGQDPSSSQADAGFNFLDDDLFGAGGELGLDGGIGDELAQELGEGWGVSASDAKHRRSVSVDQRGIAGDAISLDMDFRLDEGNFLIVGDETVVEEPDNTGRNVFRIETDKGTKNLPPPSLAGAPDAEYEQQHAAEDLSPQEAGHHPKAKRTKRTHVLFDSRTELSDDELKAARTEYLKGQDAIRADIEKKRIEKESAQMVEELIWGIPSVFQSPFLVDLWIENCRLQVHTRAEASTIEPLRELEPPSKRRRLGGAQEERPHDFSDWNAVGPEMPQDLHEADDFEITHDGRMRSSEEPGQGRNASRPPSAIGNIVDLGVNSGSQRGFFAPWDDAGPSSSAFGPAGAESDRISIDKADMRIRSRSLSASRRDSFVIPGEGHMSPAGDISRRQSHVSFDEYMLDVPAQALAADESQETDTNVVSLERRSYKFLMYAKMQMQALSGPATSLAFDSIIVPRARKVAAEGFYHCLVLATKDLLRLEQPIPYGSIMINTK